MGAFTSAQTGNWGDIATWTHGSAVPGDGDTVTIAAGHIVTVAANATVGTCGTPGTVEIDIKGWLVLGVGVTLTIKGDVKLNNGSSVTMSLGSRWLVSGGNYSCKHSGTATFNIQGSSAARCFVGAAEGYYTYFTTFSTGSDALVCDWDFCDFERIGSASVTSIKWGGGGKTFDVLIDNCYFKTFGAIEYAWMLSPNVGSKFIVNSTDFRSPLGSYIILANPTTGTVGYRSFNNCTFVGRATTTPGTVYWRTTLAAAYTIFNHVIFKNVIIDSAGNVDFVECFQSQDFVSVTNVMNFNGTTGNPKLRDSVLLALANNCHTLGFADGHTSTVDIEGCFFEAPLETGDTTNFIMAEGAAASQINIRQNVFIGHNALLPYTACNGPVLFEQNTLFCQENADFMVVFENAMGTGVVTSRSNIRYEDDDSTHSFRATEGLVLSGIGTLLDHPLWTDNNCVWDSPLDATRYNNIAIAGKTLGDVGFGSSDVRLNPNFKNKGRNFLTWVGTSTYDDGIEELLCINGRDSAGATKSHDENKTVASLLTYVRDAYTPTNLTLLTAGFDGGYIGALEPQSADDTAPNLTAPTATSTGPTTSTASVTTDDGNGTLYFIASTNATESAAAVKAALSQDVTAVGEQSISLSALNPGTTYYVHFVQINGASIESASVVSTNSITTPAIVYPEISATVAASSTSAVSATVTTDTSGGTIYGVLSTSATEMEALDIKSSADDTATVTAAVDYALDETGLATWTQYYWHIVHEDGAGLMSNVLTIPVRTLDVAIPLAFSDTAPATLLGVQVWSKMPTKAEVEGLY